MQYFKFVFIILLLMAILYLPYSTNGRVLYHRLLKSLIRLSATMVLPITILASLLFASCNSPNHKNIQQKPIDEFSMEDSIEPDTIYNIQIAEKWWRKNDTVKAVIIDTACINQRKSAIRDIGTGSLCYYGSYIYYEAPQMVELLAINNIEFKDFWPGCFGPPPGFSRYCYVEEMHREIYSSFGENFIDSLWLVAEKQFVLKFPDSIYIKEGMDIRQKYLMK